MTSWRDESEFQAEKRQRKQVYLAYMLNLCCPQSTYDLTFEPSKTLVEFKVIPISFLTPIYIAVVGDYNFTLIPGDEFCFFMSLYSS